jgi:hypothetical protein
MIMNRAYRTSTTAVSTQSLPAPLPVLTLELRNGVICTRLRTGQLEQFLPQVIEVS